MARIKIDIPNNIIFSTKMSVRIYDVNYGSHLGNDSILSMVHESRVCFFKSLGFSELDIDGLGIIQTDCAVVYKSEAFHGELLEINIAITDINKYGCDIIYLISETTSRREVARAKTGIVFFDYSKKKVSRIPDVFIKKIS